MSKYFTGRRLVLRSFAAGDSVVHSALCAVAAQRVRGTEYRTQAERLSRLEPQHCHCGARGRLAWPFTFEAFNGIFLFGHLFLRHLRILLFFAIYFSSFSIVAHEVAWLVHLL